jgi:gliding motility-associated-like protein
LYFFSVNGKENSFAIQFTYRNNINTDAMKKLYFSLIFTAILFCTVTPYAGYAIYLTILFILYSLLKRLHSTQFSLVVSILLSSNFLFSQTVITVTTTGSGTWVAPCGVTSVTVECWGGGGGGANSASLTANGGTGGGGGAYAKGTHTVTAGTTYYYNIGTGGSGAPANSVSTATAGVSSWFNSTGANAAPGTNIIGTLGVGGGIGVNNSSVTPTNAGAAASCFGNVITTSGSNGVAGSTTQGGAGGSGAAPGGGAGGTGPNSGNGTLGASPGGGGGGGNDAPANFGGNGAGGQVIITYINIIPTITLGTNPAVVKGSTSANLPYTATTNNPNQYSITWSSAAITAGFVNVSSTTLPVSPIVITVPGAAPNAAYSGTITVTNTTSGCSSSGNPFTTTVSYPTIESFPNQTFCASTFTTATAYNKVNFSLVETAATDFDANQTNQTIILTLPAGFQFNTAAGAITLNTAPGVTQDITATPTFTMNTTSITVSVTTGATQVNLDEINFVGFQIRANAAPSSGDLLRTGGTFKIYGSTSIPSNSSSDSFGHLATSGLSVYNSSNVTQYSTSPITRGCSSTSNPILQFKLNITGGACTPNDVITQFVFSTTGDVGTTSLADITKAEVYYTDTAQGFSNANYFGSIASPASTFTITGSQPLPLGNGPYYFYLTYTIPTSTVAGNTVDATMNSFKFNGTTYTTITTPNPAGGRTLVSGTCPSAPDLAPPTANTQTITAGSLVIPMDNTNQVFGGKFNLKAYGLVHALLQADIPVKWVIKSGKGKDSADFIAINATQVYPTAGATATHTFVASEFVVDSFYLDHSYYSGGQTATQVMASYTVNNVNVYKLSADVAVDVRYTLNHRPKIAVFSNGGYEAVQTAMLIAGGVINYFVQNAGDFTGLAECYTFCSEAHWDYSANPDTRPVQRVIDFVNEGGNFLAQCQGIDLYENHQPGGGHFQTTNGVSFNGNAVITNTDYNPDMAYNQYQGGITATTGAIASFWTTGTSAYKGETYNGVSTPAVTNTVVATGVHLADPDSVGSNVFYLGGHAYATTNTNTENGIRMYLNATLVPARRPTAFPLAISSNPTICLGQSVAIGPVCASGATYAWSPAGSLNSATTCDPIASPTVTTAYTVVGFNGGCIMGPTTMTVHVNPTPVMTSINSATICGNGSINIPLTSDLTSTYQWIATDNPNTTGESITTQTTSTLNNTIINTTTSVQTVIYTITPTSTLGSCTGTPQIVTVTISPAPTMTTVNTATICANAAVNIPLGANIGGSTFTWIAADNINTTGESLTTQNTATLNNAITNTTTAVQNVIYTVTPTAGGCLGTAQTVTVAVNPTPVMTSTTSATLCSGGTVSIPLTSNIASTYTWIATDNLNTTGESLTTQSTNTLSNSINNSSASSQDVFYSVTPTSGGCSGTAQTVTVTVNPTPVVTSAGTATICTGATVNISLTSNVAGVTFSWIATDNVNTTGESLTTQSTNTLSNIIINSTTIAQNITYTVTPFAGACPGTPKIVVVTVNPTPTMTSANTATICSGGTASITLTSNVASAYTWIASDNVNTTGESLTTQNTATLSNTITNNSIAVQNVIYTVTPTSTGGSCAGTAQTVTVTVNPTPTITSASTATICSGATANIIFSSNIASTYTWIATNNVNTTGESLTTQNTATLSNTIINNSTSTQNVIYTLTASAGGCSGTSQIITITVNPIPTATATPSSQTICSNNATSIALTSNIAGTTYSWTTSQSGVSGASNSSGSGITQTLTTTSTSSGTVTYSITPTSTLGSCTGTPLVVTVTVNPIPTVTATPTSQTFCSGNTTSIALTSGVAGATYSWTVSQSGVSGASSASGSSIAQTISTTGTSQGNAIYSITPTASSCSGTAITATVTVNPVPAMTSASSATICTAATVSIPLTSNVASTYTWIAADNTNTTGESLTTQSTNTLSNTITNGTTVAQNVIYTVTPTSSLGSCVGSSQIVIVKINPVPTATATPLTQTICSAGVTSIALTSNIAGTTYSWTTAQSGVTGASNSAGSNITQTLTTTGTSPGTVTYTITPTNGCTGSSIIATVTVNPTPAMTSANAATICSGGTANINLTSNVASTYTWIAANNTNTTGESITTQSTNTLSNTITNNTITAQSVIYTVTPTSTGGNCVGNSQTVTVTVNPTPTVTATPSSQAICSASTTSIALTSNIAGTTYSWTTSQSGVSGASNSSGSNITQILTTTSTSTGTATYTITPTAGACAGSALIVPITVNPIPTVTATPTSQTFCSGNTTSIALTSGVAGATYSWTVSQSGVSGASSASGSSIAQTISTTGASQGTAIYTITPTASSCSGTAITATVTVNPVPAMTSAGTSTICSNQTVNIPFTSNVASTYTWITTNNPNTTGESITTQTTSTLNNTIISTTGNTEVVVYTVTPTSTSGSCAGAAQTVSVTISPTPIVTVTPTSQAFCSGNATSIALTSNVAGTVYNWTVLQSGVSGASASSGSSITQTLTTTSVSSGTATYTITPTIGTCTGTSATATVTVNPIPSVTATPSSQSICSGNATSIALTSNVGATTYSWTVSQSGVSGATSASGSNITQTLTTVGTTSGTVTYTITPSTASCSGTAIVVTVTVNPVPSATATPVTQAVCSGSATSIALTSNVTGTTFSWTDTQTSASGASASSGSTITQTLTATGVSQGTVTYTITPLAGTCNGSTIVATVTVNPIPVAPTASSNSPVCVTNTISFSVTTVAGGTYSWAGPNSYTSNVQNPSITNAALTNAGTYSVNVTLNGCTGPNKTVSVVINPPPPSTLTVSANSPLCTGQTLNLSTPTVTAASYSWSGPNSFSSSLQNPSISNITIAANGTYTVTATVPGCGLSGTGTVNIVVNPTPVAPTATNNGPLCVGATLTLTASNTGTTYSWTGPNTFTSSTQNPSVTNITSANAGVYSVTATSLGCTSSIGATNVVVNSIPATPTVTSNSPICVGQTLNLSTSAVGGATYTWNGPNSYTASVQNPSISNAAVVNAGMYSLAITVSGCTSATRTVDVSINSTPTTPTATANNPVCVGDTLFLSAASTGGATYNWTGPNTFTSNIQNPIITGVTTSANGTYTVIANNGCASAPATVTVAVSPTPAAPVAGSNSPLCVGSTLNLTATNTSATYNWSGPNTYTSSVRNPSITNITSAEAGVYTVIATSAVGCVSPTATVNVVINSPAIVSAGGSQTVCTNNSQVTLSGTSSTGSAQWSSTGSGTFTPNNTTLTASYTPSGAEVSTGTSTLTLSSLGNGACATVTNQMVITITPSPTVSTGGSQTVCANNSQVTLNGTFAVASGISWSTSGTGTFTPDNVTPSTTYSPSTTDITAGTVTLTIATTGNGNCLVVTNTMVVTIKPAPIVNGGADIFVCSNNPNATLNGTSSTSTAQWSTSGTGTFTPSNTSLNATYVSSASDILGGVVTLTLTSNNNVSCLAVADTLTIKYTAPPTVNTGTLANVCANNSAIALNGTSSTGSGAWTTSGTGTFTPNNTTLNATYDATAADATAGIVTFTLTSTNNGGCIAVTSATTVTVTPSPTADAGINQSVCANNASVALTGSVTVASGGTWSSTGTGTFSPNNANMNTTYIPSNADTTAGSVKVILTTSGNGNCNATTDTMLVTIINAPHVFAGVDANVCLSSPNYVLNGSSSTGSATWSTLGTGTFTPNNTTLNATYQPSTSDTSAKAVTLVLTSANNGGCSAVRDTMKIVYTKIPTVSTSGNQTVCGNNANVSLSGSSSTGTGAWTSSGTGTFTPNNTTIYGTYIPSNTDTAAGIISLSLSSTGGCTIITQTISVTITDAPGAHAGADVAVCANNATVTLNGSVSGATSTGTWSTTGTGTFNPDNVTLNAIYTPSNADTTSGSVTMILTSSGNGNCLANADTMKITYTHAPHTTVASDATVCANSAVVLSGSVSGGTGNGMWTTTNGNGTFTPNNTTLNASYNTVSADTVPTKVTLILTSINNGGCLASSDTMLVTVNPGPIVNAGTDQTMCANNVSIALSGTVVVASGGQWSSLGSGTFTPNNTDLHGSYNPTASEISSGIITVVLTSTGNVLCQAVTDTMKVYLTPAPNVNAGADIFICNSSTTTMLNGSVSGGSTTGQWTTLGSGTFTPNNNTLNATYNLSTADTTAGSVKLVLTSTNNLTCNAVTDTVVIKLNSAPNVFAGNDTTLCGNVNTVALNGFISGNIVGHWTTNGNGAFTPNDSTLNGTYTASSNDISAGMVVLTLTSDVNGQCSAAVDSVKITFSPATIVNAGVNIPVCNGVMTAQLNGIVSGGTTSGQWTTLGSGTFTPNDTTLNATYNLSTTDTTAGSVKIVLTSTHNGSCSTVSDTVLISMTTVAVTYAGNDTSICGNTALVPLHGTVTGGSGLGVWISNGTGTFTPDSTTLNANYLPSVADINSGVVTLTLSSIQNGSCPQSLDSMKITITPTPIVNAGSNIAICNGAMSTPLNGSITGGSTTGIWNTLGTGTFTPNDSTLNATYNISVADSTAGSVSLVLSSTHNGSCSVVKDTVLITLNSIPTVSVGNDTSICSSVNSIQLQGTITGGSPTGQWTSMGTGTFTPNDSTLNASYQPSVSDVTAGNVTLTFTSTHNCVNKADSLKLTIQSAPFVNAGSNISLCGSMSTPLSGTITGGAGTIIWSTLGSGTFAPIDTTLNTNYNLSSADSTAGSVSVIFTSTHNGSCSAAIDTVLITLNPITTTFAGNDTIVCSGASGIQLHGVVNGGSATGIWSTAGTGTFTPNSTTLNASYQASATDIITGSVKLVLTSTNNCVNTSDTMKITFAPTATVSAGRDTSICSSNAIALSGSVTTGSIAHWSTIGTGTFTPNDSTLNATYNPSITDNDTLLFILTLNTSASCGTVLDTMTVYRNGQPTALFSVNNACIGQSVSFTDNSTPGGGSITSWYWNFGMADTSTARNPSYTYTVSGTFTVQLQVSSGGSCKDSISKIININPTPVAAFTLTANCMSDSVKFINNSTISQGNLTAWSWSFGDGNNSNLQNPDQLYDSLATYTVSLTASSDSGCTASVTHTLTVHPSPLAGLTAQSNCVSLLVNFKDTSKVILPDTISSYSWNFGDGGISAVANPSHTYSTTGTYTVLLQVQSNNGCTDTATKVITTGSLVIAQYIPDGGNYSVNQNIDFTNQSTGASLYNWNFGDNSTTSTLSNPSHSFNISGTYTVTLIASNNLGCSDTVKHAFVINSNGHTVPTGFTPNGDGLNDLFYIMGGPFDQYELRVFNEWGQQIFISNYQADKWDGTFNGKAQPAGTYRYTFNGNLDGQSLKLSGEINIIQ